MSKNSNVVCRCSVCRSCMGPPPRDRRALADSLGDLVAEATEDYAETDRIEAIEADAEQCYDEWLLLPEDVEPLPVHGPRTLNAATYAVLGEDW